MAIASLPSEAMGKTGHLEIVKRWGTISHLKSTQTSSTLPDGDEDDDSSPWTSCTSSASITPVGADGMACRRLEAVVTDDARASQEEKKLQNVWIVALGGHIDGRQRFSVLFSRELSCTPSLKTAEETKLLQDWLAAL